MQLRSAKDFEITLWQEHIYVEYIEKAVEILLHIRNYLNTIKLLLWNIKFGPTDFKNTHNEILSFHTFIDIMRYFILLRYVSFRGTNTPPPLPSTPPSLHPPPPPQFSKRLASNLGRARPDYLAGQIYNLYIFG